MQNEDLYSTHSELVEHTIVVLTQRLRLRRPDADDFAQDLRLFVIAHAPAILTRFEQRSSFDTYLTRVLSNVADVGKAAFALAEIAGARGAD